MAYTKEQIQTFRDEYVKTYSLKKAMKTLGYPSTRTTAHSWTTHDRGRCHVNIKLHDNPTAFRIINDLKREDDATISKRYGITEELAHWHRYFILTEDGRRSLVLYGWVHHISVEELAERFDLPVVVLEKLGFKNVPCGNVGPKSSLENVDIIEKAIRTVNEDILGISLKNYV